MKLRKLLHGGWIVACILICHAGYSQLTAADFDRALNIQEKLRALAVNLPEQPVWLEGSDSCVYRKSIESGHEFELVDAVAETRQPAFDYEKLAAALFAASNKNYKAAALPFFNFHFESNRTAIAFVANGARWHCDLKAYTCANVGATRPGNGEDADSLRVLAKPAMQPGRA